MEKSYDTHKQEAETETKDRSDAQTAAITSVPYEVSKKLLMYPKKKKKVKVNKHGKGIYQKELNFLLTFSS